MSLMARLAYSARLARYDATVNTPRTTQTGWWAESTKDGGGHYGVGQTNPSTVRSLCGRVFVPQTNPLAGVAKCQRRPADPDHACPRCMALLEERGKPPTDRSDKIAPKSEAT